MPIHLYCEHMINIRTISLQASLTSVTNKETRATLSADGTALFLTHEGEEARIKLPINVSPNKQSNASVVLPAAPSKEVSLRLQLEHKDELSNGSSVTGSTVRDDGNLTPWTAGDLTSQTQIACAKCDQVLVPRGRVAEWKDLPSEGWAEMMEYWHCHKPTDHDIEDHAGSQKGYAASSRLEVRSGVGLVDPVHLLLADEDCEQVKCSLNSNLLCAGCEAIVGQQDNTISKGYRLQKQRLALSKSIDTAHTSYDPAKWLACFLLAAVDAQGVRKFVVHTSISQQDRATSTSPPFLRVWVFTPDLTVSTSRKPPDPIRVMKVLWQREEETDTADLDASGITSRLNAQSLSTGELQLMQDEMTLLSEELESSGLWLPEGARTLQGWNVGLLQRFSEEDLST